MLDALTSEQFAELLLFFKVDEEEREISKAQSAAAAMENWLENKARNQQNPNRVIRGERIG